MDYNDYQIPNTTTLNKMLEEYGNFPQSVKKDFSNEVFSDLNILYSSCLHINNEYNNTIKQALSTCKNYINKCLENLLAIHNIKVQKITTISEINIFDFILNLINVLNKTTTWLSFEEKPFNKSFIKKLNFE